MKLIDCYVHSVPVTMGEISQRLPAYFRQRGVHMLGSFGIKNPMSVLRVDAQGPNGDQLDLCRACCGGWNEACAVYPNEGGEKSVESYPVKVSAEGMVLVYVWMIERLW